MPQKKQAPGCRKGTYAGRLAHRCKAIIPYGTSLVNTIYCVLWVKKYTYCVFFCQKQNNRHDTGCPACNKIFPIHNPVAGEDSNIITRANVLVKDYFACNWCRFFPTPGVGFFRHLQHHSFSPREHTRGNRNAKNISPLLHPRPAASHPALC